ncbi:hypothetical protein ES703_84273 [subsurface metagenome]
MKLSKTTKGDIKLILISIALLAGLIWAGVSCAGFDQWAPTPSPEEPTEVEKPPTPTAITTEDRAILAVYEHLLSQAESYQAKTYLADFYTACDNWTAKSELLKDGTSLWYVTVDMTEVAGWKEKPYWKQASWLVLEDGKVIPSHRFKANALRIEADLQELSLQPEPPPSPSPMESED